MRLGLPLRDVRGVWICVVIAWVFYVATMARDLSLYDSPELALVAVQGGLSHPIGQPLHTLFGLVFAHIPGVSPLLGLPLLSATFGALCVVPATAIAEQFVPDAPPTRHIIPVVVLLHTFHFAMWEAATRTEVYSLAAFFSLMALAFLARPSSEILSTKTTFLAGLCLGLAGAANGYTCALVVAALVPALIGAVRSRRVGPRAIGAGMGGALLGLLPYVYVPLIAWRDDVLVWGAPRTWDTLLAYFRGADYAHNRGIDLPTFFAHLGAWVEHATRTGTIPIAIVGAAGYVALGARTALGRWSAPLWMLATAVLLCSHVVFHPEITDLVDYIGLPLMALSAGSAALCVRAYNSTRPVWVAPFWMILALSVVWGDPINGRSTRSEDHVARTLVEEAFREMPRNAIAIVESDHFVAPALYLQEIERQRPDVVVIARGLASSSWYWAHLYQRHPDLTSFEIRGSGGRDARIGRFLAVSGGRPIFVEHAGIAEALGAPICDVGMWVRIGTCAKGLDPSRSTRVLSVQRDAVCNGSPPADEVLAQVGILRGEALWKLGRPAEALAAFRAGAPCGSLPPLAPSARSLAAPALRGAIPAWSREAAIADPARNLMMAAMLLSAAGETDAADAHLRRAADRDLPEAVRLWERRHPR